MSQPPCYPAPLYYNTILHITLSSTSPLPIPFHIKPPFSHHPKLISSYPQQYPHEIPPYSPNAQKSFRVSSPSSASTALLLWAVVSNSQSAHCCCPCSICSLCCSPPVPDFWKWNGHSQHRNLKLFSKRWWCRDLRWKRSFGYCA